MSGLAFDGGGMREYKEKTEREGGSLAGDACGALYLFISLSVVAQSDRLTAQKYIRKSLPRSWSLL